MWSGGLLFVIGMCSFVAAIFAHGEWRLPFVIGAVAGCAAALYQYWWSRNVFEDATSTTSRVMRRPWRRAHA